MVKLFDVKPGEIYPTAPDDVQPVAPKKKLALYAAVPDGNTITSGGTYTLAAGFSGTITINTDAAVTIDGTNAGKLSDVKIIASSSNSDVTIKNLNVANDSGNVITFGNGTENKLTLAGTNTLQTSDTWAAVVNVGGGLTVNGAGSLDVTAGAQGSGIGYNSYAQSNANITINGGTINTTTNMGAGIGSGSNGSIGNITINSGTVNTVGRYGAGVGSGYQSTVGDLTINGGAITSTNYTGAGVGSGGYDGSIGNITINSGTFKLYSEWGAGIGSGYQSTVGDIEMNSLATIDSGSIYGFNIGAGKSGTANEVTYIYSGGNATINKYGGEETIKIASGTVNGYSTNDDGDVIFKIGNGSLTLKYMQGHYITLTDKTGKVSTQFYGTDYSQQDVIENYVQSMVHTVLNDNDKLKSDEAIQLSSPFYSTQEVIDRMVADCERLKDPETFLRQCCGIIFNNSDRGAITGWDAGTATIAANEELYTTGGDAVYPDATTFTIRGLTFTVPKKNTLTEQEQLAVKGLYSWWLEDSIKLLEKSYGVKFNGQKVSVVFQNEPNGYGVAYTGAGSSGTAFQITVNMGKLTLTEDNLRYCISDILAHEMTHGLMRTFNFNDCSKNYMREGMSDLTIGNNDRERLYTLAADSTKLAYYLDLNKDFNYLTHPKDYDYMYPLGYMFFRYIARQAANSYDADGNYAWKDYSFIEGTAASEFLTGSGKGVTISAGAGADTITAYGEKMAVLSGAGNDSIMVSSLAGGASVQGGAGSDTIRNGAANVLFTHLTGDGNDYIIGFNATSTLALDTDTCSSVKSGNNFIITANNEKITLQGAATLSTVNISLTEKGAQSINNTVNNKLIIGSDYDDTVINSGGNVTIFGGKGNDYVGNSCSSNVTIDGGTDDDSIYNHSANVSIDGSSGNDYINNTGKNTKLNGGDGADYIRSHSGSSNSTIDGGAGNDTIDSWDDNASIDGGTGDDSISNYGGNVTIFGGKGADTIENRWSFVTIDGGEGNDSISNNRSNVTIDGGAGNDIMTNNDADATFIYHTGDGNDTVFGFNANSTLSIDDGTGTYSTVKSGSDMLVKVGTGSVTFKNAANLSKLNILGEEYSQNIWKLNGTTATYGDLITVTGVKSLDGVSLSGKTVTISNAALNKSTVTISNGYTLALGSDVAKTSTTAAKWTGSGSTYTYTASGTSAGYSLSGNKISYTSASGGDKFTIAGVKNTNAVTVSGKKVTVGSASLNGKAVTLTGDFTLALGSDVATSAKKIAGAFSTVSKGTATYKTTATSDFYKLSGKKISYVAGTGGQVITFKNLNTATKLSALKNGVTVAEQSNGTYKVTFKNSAVLTTKAPTISAAKGLKYTVAVADALKPVTKSAWTVSGTTATFRTTTTAGYTVNSKNAVVYSASKTGSPLIELNGLAKGVKASSLAAPKNKVVTLNATVLGANSSVKSNGGGYTLNLTDNMSGKKFIGTAKVDTLTVAANNANVDAGAGNDVVTVGGLKVTLSSGAGNDKLTGSKNVDLIYGGAGNDSILGNGGNDKIFGDAGNDSLRGGAGNDTLSGGKGNDSLWGDAGSDTFLYSSGDGKDVFYGFADDDLLQITGTFSASYNKSKDEIYFKVGSTANAITLRDFTATSFNVNGDTYSISGNKFIKK